MKTKEELIAIKNELETLNKKLAELTEEELAQVNGGATLPPGVKPIGQTRRIGNLLFSGHVGKYDGVPGKGYYIVDDDSDEWYMGTMVRTYEKNWLVCTVRHHVFDVKMHNGAFIATTKIDFCGDDVTLYTHCYDM